MFKIIAGIAIGAAFAPFWIKCYYAAKQSVKETIKKLKGQ